MPGATELHDGSVALSELGSALARSSAESLTGQRTQLAEGLLRTALTMWENPEARPRLLEAVRGATTSEEGAAGMREFMSSQLFAQAGQALGGEPMDIDQVAETLNVSPLNINAAQAQVWGVGMLRYVVQLEPIASASVDEIIEVLAPTIQRYLVG